MTAAIALILLFMLMALRVPIAFATLGAALVYFVFAPVPAEIFIQQVTNGLLPFPILAVPFFILTGSLMARGGIATRVLGFADALVGHRRGGLGQVNVVNSVLIGGMSGSANADAAIDSRVVVPVMVRHGYSRSFAAAITSASAVIAPILPPGIGLILYGVLASVSIGRLFIGGVVPALMMAVALSIVVDRISKRRGYGSTRSERLPFAAVLRSARDAIWALLMPILLLVGLRLGVFTPTELGALASFYALFVGVVMYRELALRDVLSALRETVLTTAILALILAAASAISYIITVEQIPQTLIEGLTGFSDNPYVILLLINLLLVALGALFESTALLVILTPILAPVAAGLGIDLVHFGLILVINLTIGAITPPVGPILFTVATITGISVEELSKDLFPFVGALVVVLLLVTYVPALVTGLPGVMMG